MKLSAALVALGLAGAALAQDAQPTLPACAQDCANKFLQEGIGNCGSDPACICANKSFIGDISCCLIGVCDDAAQTAAVIFANSLCSAFKVSDLPTAPSCSTAAVQTQSASSQSTTGTTTGPITSSPSATTSATADAASSSTASDNMGPRPTAAAVGLGAVGGIMAAVALL
ncbi:uncharacterized protein CTHT_0030500 [Thermochaetoides thermophila DSM 1495]|uniref:CFEM domain-containing protein n=1 Tax=Chaetomium thermophilum (strain DSM 1495 / CBS 144.50 / IMI 039719) TaxID=759272 RepID=G0S3S8_CHATD|nr:hypothetical protein CTHT_0030500 [Thermochaetoides thermophila DSM 1495]EGS21204.1 hypothetical protein CTHT_0030500 [Thermochaetoides thermophila DSM 1495]